MYAVFDKKEEKFVSINGGDMFYHSLGNALLDVKKSFWYNYEKDKSRYDIVEVSIDFLNYDFYKKQAKQEIYSLHEIGYKDMSFHSKHELLEVARYHANSYEYRAIPKTFDQALKYFKKYGFEVKKLNKRDIDDIQLLA